MSISKNPGKTRLSPLEFRLFRSIGDSMRGEKVLVACSGGRDSLALASVLSRIHRRGGFEILALVYVDHGPSKDPAIVRYRRSALERVRAFAEELGHEFVVAGPAARELTNEEALRDFRHDVLNSLASEMGATAIAFAHHADDLLETRLIRLMRGTGARGLQAMTTRRGLAWRPFLHETREAISSYVSDHSIEWIEDPSNADTGPLRNWVRLELLPILEWKRPGSAKAVARSLDLVAQELAVEVPVNVAKLDRAEFEALSLVERKRALTHYASGRATKALTSKQVEEVLKRLSSFQMQRRRTGAFNVAGLEWRISSNEIVATRVAKRHDIEIH